MTPEHAEMQPMNANPDMTNTAAVPKGAPARAKPQAVQFPYQSTIAQMRQEAAVRQQNQLIREAQTIYEDVQANEQAANEALAAGDRDSAAYYVEQLQEKEQELAHVAERLPQPAPPDDPHKR